MNHLKVNDSAEQYFTLWKAMVEPKWQLRIICDKNCEIRR